MSEHLRDRIVRKLDGLSDERLYQILDYVEFLSSKYAERQAQAAAPNPFTKFAEAVEDKMRAGRVSTATIAETMSLMNRAMGVLNGVAAAGKSVANDLAGAAQRAQAAATQSATAAAAGSAPPAGSGGAGTSGAGPTPAAPPPAPPASNASVGDTQQ